MARNQQIPTTNAALRALGILKKYLLPGLQQSEVCPLTLAEPPFYLSPGVKIKLTAGKPLFWKGTRKGFYNATTYSWEDYGVHMTQFPYLGYIVAGETDWRIGITQKTAKRLGNKFLKSTFATLTIPHGTLFLMPAGVPYSNLPPITERTPANLQILWMRFHRLGMQYHLSSILRNGNYYGEPSRYLSDSRTLTLMETLIEELRYFSPSQELLRTLMLSIMLRFQRNLQDPINQENIPIPTAPANGHKVTDFITQAIAYIEANFRYKVTVDDIANHIYCSPSYLRRIFQQEKGITITEYLAQFRINYACALLRETTLNVNHVGRTVGFPNHSSFCQVFQRRLGCSPSAYKNEASE